MIEHTTEHCMNLDTATELANIWTNCKGLDDTDYTKSPHNWRKEYNTAMPGEPKYPSEPDMCWAVTNRFDPRVAKGE